MNALYEQAITGLVDTGYAIIEDFVDEETIRGLRYNLQSQFDDGEFKRAGIGKWNNFQKNTEIRNDYIHWLNNRSEEPTERHLIELVQDFVDYLNRTCFTGILSFEFHYAIYPKGSFYKRHLDQFSNDDSRRYTMIFYLNENWGEKDGGQLVLYLGNETVTILPKGGTLVFFESQKIEHEVLPSYRERMSLTGWLKNSETRILL